MTLIKKIIPSKKFISLVSLGMEKQHNWLLLVTHENQQTTHHFFGNEVDHKKIVESYVEQSIPKSSKPAILVELKAGTNKHDSLKSAFQQFHIAKRLGEGEYYIPVTKITPSQKKKVAKVVGQMLRKAKQKV